MYAARCRNDHIYNAPIGPSIPCHLYAVDFRNLACRKYASLGIWYNRSFALHTKENPYQKSPNDDKPLAKPLGGQASCSDRQHLQFGYRSFPPSLSGISEKCSPAPDNNLMHPIRLLLRERDLLLCKP